MERLDFRTKELAILRFREVLGVAVLRVQELLRGVAERVPAAMQLRKLSLTDQRANFVSVHFIFSSR